MLPKPNLTIVLFFLKVEGFKRAKHLSNLRICGLRLMGSKTSLEVNGLVMELADLAVIAFQ